MGHQTSLVLTQQALINYTPPAAVTGAGRTLTVQEVLSGMINRVLGAARTDTLPDAPSLIAAMSLGGYAPPVGASFDFVVRNQDAATNVHTLAVGSGITAAAVGTLTTPAASNHAFRLVVTGGATMDLYSMGAVTT